MAIVEKEIKWCGSFIFLMKARKKGAGLKNDKPVGGGCYISVIRARRVFEVAVLSRTRTPKERSSPELMIRLSISVRISVPLFHRSPVRFPEIERHLSPVYLDWNSQPLEFNTPFSFSSRSPLQFSNIPAPHFIGRGDYNTRVILCL